MKVVAVFHSDEMTVRRLVLAFRNRCVVRAFTHIEEVRELIANGTIIASVVDFCHRQEFVDDLAIDLIARLHTAYPTVPVVGYVEFTPQRARDILLAAHAGASELILRDVDDLDAVVDRIVDMGTMTDVASRLRVAIAGIVPSNLQEFFLFCVQHAGSGITVEGVTARLHRNRKTISNWLVAAKLPPPYRIIGWARILVAARLLEDPSRSLEKVARELHFASGTALRNIIRRYLGSGPDLLRERGGFEYALAKFVEVLRTGVHRAER